VSTRATREMVAERRRDAAAIVGNDEHYNGWANRETWGVALWLDNDQGMQEAVHEALREAADMQTDGLTASSAGEIVREYLDELFDVDTYDGSLPGGLVNMLTDIGSLWRVDWREIGAAFLRDVHEQGVETTGGAL
jgi:hypothetical protein